MPVAVPYAHYYTPTLLPFSYSYSLFWNFNSDLTIWCFDYSLLSLISLQSHLAHRLSQSHSPINISSLLQHKSHASHTTAAIFTSLHSPGSGSTSRLCALPLHLHPFNSTQLGSHSHQSQTPTLFLKTLYSPCVLSFVASASLPA